MNHFNILQGSDPRHMAEWYHRIQKLAERTRLGILISISSDPRHAFAQNPLANMTAGSFSHFPKPTGLAAARNVDLVQHFADIAWQEYLAVGICLALHPMADLATEPRRARTNGTFGEDADLTAQLIAASIRGFQSESLGKQSVACMTKHFPGAGPQMNGEDVRFACGREQVYLGNNFDYHLKPFEAAFKAGTAQIIRMMPCPLAFRSKKLALASTRMGSPVDCAANMASMAWSAQIGGCSL